MRWGSHLCGSLLPDSSRPPQILRDCMPRPIFRRVTNKSTSKAHHNKSLILNLACGSTVAMPEALHSLLEGYVLGLFTSLHYPSTHLRALDTVQTLFCLSPTQRH